MNKRQKTKIAILSACLSVIFLYSIHSWSQLGIGRQTIMQFSPTHSVLRAPAPYLMQPVTMDRGRSNPQFLNGVGGVSFDQVAKPGQNLAVRSLSLKYLAEGVDGERLELIINDKKVEVCLPDWLLVPIANYAESHYYSCITLFGALEDREVQKLVTDNEGRVINYHPALDNMLLGIRLAYMDMLVMFPFATDLPRNREGEYILGTGETDPDLQTNQEGRSLLSQHMMAVDNKHRVKFRSYVVTDYTRNIQFNVIRDSLTISGNPYFYCWRSNRDRQDYDNDHVANEISAKYNNEVNTLRGNGDDSRVRTWLIQTLIDLSCKYKGNYSFYQSGTFVELVALYLPEEKAQFLEKYKTEALFDMLVHTEAMMQAEGIEYMKQYSADLSARPDLFRASNPAVWNATVQTMRFAAFFRYVRSNFPDSWDVFIDQVRSLDPRPRVETPNILYNAENAELERAIRSSQRGDHE
jgi:hypothetical protein